MTDETASTADTARIAYFMMTASFNDYQLNSMLQAVDAAVILESTRLPGSRSTLERQ
jgi:hypothetical protein